MIEEISKMKRFNKTNFKPEINNSLFDPNERLINSQNEGINSNDDSDDIIRDPRNKKNKEYN